MEQTVFQIGEKEAEEIISELYDWSGYDFSNYSAPSIVRRFQRYADMKRLQSSEEFLNLIRSDSRVLNEFIEEITVNVTEMFRDPFFFKIIREQVLPQLKNVSPLKIWHAGCSSGEEAFSMAIVLKEEGLLEKSIIYATDINQSVLETARKGIFNLDNLKLYESNYRESDAVGNFKNYIQIKNGEAVISSEIRDKIIFSTHNLVSDTAFNRFDLVVCRNVLIYFNKELQNAVLQTFYDSLNPGGFLALGSKESIMFSPVHHLLEEHHARFKIWKRKV